VADDSFFRSLIESGPDLISVIGAEGAVRYASPSFGKVLGISPSDVAGKPLVWLVHPEDVPRLRERLTAPSPAAGEHGFELRLRDKDGMWRVFEVVLRDLTRDPAIAGLVVNCREVAARRPAALQPAHEEVDLLTGLPSRAALTRRLESALEAAARDGSTVAVLFVDLDRFKQVNDTLGHAVGDGLLERIVARLQARLRPSDFLARVGGDEFTAVLSGLSTAEEAGRCGRELLEALSAPFQVDGYEFHVTASIGISLFPRDGSDAATLLRNADRAMYRAKNLGKNDIQYFTADLGETALERLGLENRLHHALDNGEFRLYYEPQVDARGTLRGLEVLLAWEHATLGRIPASEFIPIAEETGLIVGIGSWVLGEACRQVAAISGAGSRPVKVAVNVSAVQFGRTDFVQTVLAALEQSGLPPDRLELELTESLVMRDAIAATRRMAELRALGVAISIDDFGTGYSSLSYLRRLPVSALKIDRSFLEEVPAPDGTLPLVQAIVALAHNMGLSVIAEGVETREQFALLRSAGCDLMQGYLFGEAAPADKIGSLLAQPRLIEPD